MFGVASTLFVSTNFYELFEKSAICNWLLAFETAKKLLWKQKRTLQKQLLQEAENFRAVL